MMKQRIKDNKKEKGKNKSHLPKPLQLIMYKILPVLVFLGIGFFFAPTISMYVQNNDVPAVNRQSKAVMFYKADCEKCQKAYPVVFWHNVFHANQPKQQIQVINVQIPEQQHFISDYGIQETPTFMTTNNQQDRAVLTDKNDITKYIERK
ncbi:thioredoxin domain-containing protein [Leuconostoc citreum]|uniref:thioredoxin domain-containing protein n=1 Tax=Leuconostoc citreum TaxID=33964 RepID=UPI00200AD7D2|nr:thioredoxin domain-containing protein [Leuconostoc citreum]MCK8605647.1 thioredoxin domain-containing protein [Leuconostoc citreum]